MTRSEFLQKLTESKEYFDWRVHITHEIRAWKDGTPYCPLTAICLLEQNTYFSIGMAAKAGEVLNLDPSIAVDIMCSADSMYEFHRKSLLKALNLKELEN